MNDKKKLKLILIIAIVSILTILGVTYAFYNYTRTGENNKLIAGEVYLRYIENNQLTLNNALPETKASALSKDNNIFSFKIEGKNTSTNDIFYDIIISHGDSQTGKSRLKDNHIRIYLERDGVTLIDGEIYDSWDNPVIYTDKMPALTNSHTVFNYELRMWVDEDVTVSDTDPTADYDTTTWNNSYASLKLHVNSGGVFENAQPASCFAYGVVEDATSDSVNVEYTPMLITQPLSYNFSPENVAKCQEFSMIFFGSTDISDAQDGYQSFCSGAGTINGISIETGLAGGGFGSIDEVAPEIGVVNYEVGETKYYKLNTSEEGINACTNYFAVLDGGDSDDYTYYCEGNDWHNGLKIYEAFVVGEVDRDALINLNVFTPITFDPAKAEIRIVRYKVEECGPDVSIPSYIDGLPVTTIGCMDNECINLIGDPDSGSVYAFRGMNINTIKLPNTIKYIGQEAIHQTNITSVVIPNSVVSIGKYGFSNNELTNVNIQGNPIIGSYAFSSYHSSSFLTFSYGGTCDELKGYTNIFASSRKPQTIITSDSNSCSY